jgi:tRNA pseudouridine55 synthase
LDPISDKITPLPISEEISSEKIPEFNFHEGEILLVDKPIRWTSFDIIRKVRKTTKCKKIGHAGTLDPLASGLLILCTGKFTKKINEFQDLDKEYTGKMILGKTTPSYDTETEVNSENDISELKEEALKEACKKFIGTIMQTPPLFSAIKVDGERLYKKARRGEDIKIQPRQVHIAEFEITEFNLPEISFKVVCSKGTYIRSLVRDFGEDLQSGAYMSELRRTRIGSFHVNDALTVRTIVTLKKKKI